MGKVFLAGCVLISGLVFAEGLWAANTEVMLPASGKAAQAKTAVDEGYVLKTGDRVKITVYPEDEYVKGGEMVISTEGNITLPLIGKVGVGGKKVREAEASVREVIDKDYLVNPEVVIEVLAKGEKNKMSLVLLGAVKKPGTYELEKGERKVTLLKLLSEAGGFSDVANIKRIKIVRNENGKKQVFDANAESIMSGNSPDIELQSGDIVNVAESIF